MTARPNPTSGSASARPRIATALHGDLPRDSRVTGSPKKLSEALAAGVPVVVSYVPELRRVVLVDPQLPLGGTCDPSSRTSTAAEVRTIVELPACARADLRRHCLDAAHRRWNWETEGEGLLALQRRLLQTVSDKATR